MWHCLKMSYSTSTTLYRLEDCNQQNVQISWYEEECVLLNAHFNWQDNSRRLVTCKPKRLCAGSILKKYSKF